MEYSCSDDQLWDKIEKDDYNAFRILFEKYYTLLCNYSLNFLKDNFLAEDVVQEVYVKIWNYRKEIKISGSLKRYLYSSVKNGCLNRLKSESVRQQYRYNLYREENSLISMVEVEKEEFRNHLFQCIEKLPPRCREVFAKSRFDELKQENIALSLDISLKTVKAQIGKALKLIRECLQFSCPEYL